MLVLINKNSGGGTALKKWKRVYQKLNLNSSTKIFISESNSSSEEAILEALNKGKIDFLIAGGDGSINNFINQLIRLAEPEIIQEVKLGAIGIGSSNDFHKPFCTENIVQNIPFKLNFDSAIHRDVGCLMFKKDEKLCKKYFLINASLGVTAEGNKFFNNPDLLLKHLKIINTQTAITYAAIKNILSYKNLVATIRSNGYSFEVNISNMGIIKSPYFTGNLKYDSNPSFKNGLFDIHLYQLLSKSKLIKLYNVLSKGISDKEFNKKYWQTDRITISADEEFAVEFDGEVITTKHAEFSVIPGLIKVCTN